MQNVYRLKLLYSYCSPELLSEFSFTRRFGFFISKMICLFYAKSKKIISEICFVLQKSEKMFYFRLNVPEFGQLSLDKSKKMFYNIKQKQCSD